MAGDQTGHTARRAASALAAGDLTAGIELYRKALTETPESPPILYNLALALEAAGGADGVGEARKLLRKSADLSPSDADALSELGRLEIAENRLAAAAEVLDEAVRRQPGHPGSLNNRGVVSFLKGRYAEAAGFFCRAVEADPNLADGWFNLADALDETGDAAGAAEARSRLEDADG